MTGAIRKSHCKKRIQFFIVFCIFVGIFFYHFPFLLILAFIFFVNTDFEVDRILQKYEIYTCIRELLGNEEKYQKFKKGVHSIDSQIAKYKGKNKKQKKLEKTEKIDKINYTREVLTYSPSKMRPIIKTKLSTNKQKLGTKKKKTSEFSFNNGKSVWDDYESVLDKFGK